MFESHVVPRLAGLGGGRRMERRSLGIHGLTESEVDTRIAPIYQSYPGIQTTVLAASGCISVWLQQWRSPDEDVTDLEELSTRIQKVLGDCIFTTADENLEQVVGRLLRESGQTLAIAESCTAGMIGAALSRVPGCSTYFQGGVICYNNERKIDLCYVPRELLERHGAVSAEVAEALARGVRSAAHSSLGLSVTGIAGPSGGSEQKPVGLVYIGLADATRCTHTRRIFPGDRQTVRELTTTAALGRLRRFLMPGESIP